jgi:hypothetical protein
LLPFLTVEACFDAGACAASKLAASRLWPFGVRETDGMKVAQQLIAGYRGSDGQVRETDD